MPACSIAHIFPVRPKPVCTSSTTRTIPALVAELAHALEELRRRDHEPALAEHGLDDDGGHFKGNLREERALKRGQSGHHVRPVMGVRERDAVDLGRERAEAGLVRVRLGGHRHRQHRPAVEGSFEADAGLALRVGAGELDRVPDRLRPRVEERDALLARVGVSAFNRSPSSTYTSYGTIVKSVWLNLAWRCGAAATTRGCECPTFRQPTPPVKLMKVLPSTSAKIVAPRPSAITTA